MIEIVQIEDLQVHPCRPGVTKGMELFNHFIDGSCESVGPKFAGVAPDSTGASNHIVFVFTHAEHLGGGEND